MADGTTIAALGVAITTDAPQAASEMDQATAAAQRLQATVQDLAIKKTGLTKAELDLATAQNSGTKVTRDMIAAVGDHAKALQILNDAEKVVTTQADAEAKALADLQDRAARLTAALDPLARAQATMAARTKEANELNQAGILVGDQHTAVLGKIQGAYDDAAKAAEHVAGATSTVTRESLVLAREFARGNFTRMAGSATILAQALGVLKYALNPVAIGIAAATAVVVGFELAVAKAQEQTEKYTALSQGVGAAMGLTAQSIKGAGDAAAAQGQMSKAAAEDMAGSYAALGAFTAPILQQLVAHTEDFANATGGDAKSAAKEFGSALADPAKGVETLNEKFHVFNQTMVEHIQQLAATGDKEQAQREILKGLEPVWDDQAKHVGGLVGALKDVVTWAQNAGHALVQAASGDQRVLADRIFDLQKQSSQEKAFGGAAAEHARTVTDPEIARLQKEAQDADQRQRDAEANTRSTNAAGAVSTAMPWIKQHQDLSNGLDNINARLADFHTAAQKADPEYARLVEAQERYTNALKSWADPAQKAHDLELARIAVANAHTPAQKAAANAQMERAKVEGELGTTTELGTKIQDAATLALDKATNAANKHKDKVVELTGKLAEQIAGLQGEADGFNLYSGASLTAEARAKALADAHQAGGAASQFYAQELRKLVLETVASADKAAAAAEDKAQAEAKANVLMAQTGVSQGVANKLVADAAELDKLHSAALVAKGADLARVNAAIAATTQAQADKNKADTDALFIAKAQADTNQNETLALEATLIGASNRERAVALAQLKEEQALRAAGVAKSDPRYGTDVAAAGATAGRGVDLAAAQAKYNTQLKASETLLANIQGMGTGVAASLATGFGHAGTAIGGVVNGLIDTAVQLQKVTDAQNAYIAAQGAQADPMVLANYEQQATNLKVAAWGNELEAFKGLFGQKTAMYTVLQSAEEAFRVYQLAMQVKAVAGYFIEAAAHVATGATHVAVEGITTASTLAGAAAKVPANTAVGASKMFADLGPWGFAAVAAMAAVMAGFAFAGAGGGGGAGSAPGADDAKNAQAAQGAGTVLGDPAAKSSSIADSLSLVAKNSNTSLSFDNQQLKTLQAINTNIGALTAQLAKDLGIGGVLDTSVLGLGSTGGGGIFGKTTTKTLQDQGLSFSAATISQILAGGLNGQAYNEIATQKSSLFGSSSKLKTTDTALDAATVSDFTKVIASLETGVISAAKGVGIDGAKAVLDQFQLSLGTVSLKGLTGTALTDAVNAIFSKAGDQMAAALFPEVAKFQKAGEGAMATLERLAHDSQVLDTDLQSVGKTFGAVGLSSIGLRETLVDAFGSIDALDSAITGYHDAILTDAEKLAPIQAAVTAQMAKLGLAGVTTKASFEQVVNSIDLTTQKGQDLFYALMNLAPAFGQVADAATAAQATAVTALTDAYGRESKPLTDLISKFTTLSASLKAFGAGLDSQYGQLSPTDAYANAKATYESTKAAAQAGDTTAQGNYQTVADAFLKASQGYNATSAPYFKDLAEVKNDTAAMAKYADAQVDSAQAQLNALDKLVNASLAAAGVNTSVLGGVVTVNASVLSVRDAVVALASATSAAAASSTAAQAAIAKGVGGSGTPAAATPTTQGTPVTGAQRPADWAAYVEMWPDLVAYYHSGNVSSKMTEAQFGQYQYNNYGKGEGRLAPVGFASGGAFGPGGIVTRPTAFNSGAGSSVAGEAGWEAVLPLSNVGGKLGVASNGNDKETKALLQQILAALQAGQAQYAAGTQMLAEGLHGVTQESKAQSRALRDVASKVGRG